MGSSLAFYPLPFEKKQRAKARLDPDIFDSVKGVKFSPLPCG